MNQEGSFEGARRRVLQLAREIEQLSQSSAPPERFFPEFLQMLVTALGARAGAVWLLDANQRLNLVGDVRFDETLIRNSAESQRLNQQLLTDVLSTGQAGLHSPDDGKNGKLPSDHLIILAALQTGEDCLGVVEVFQRLDAPREARPGYLQFVEQMCGYASHYMERRQQVVTADSPVKFLEQLEQYILELQRTLNLAEVASTAANDGRQLLSCDRMSIAIRRGKKTVIKAISGQDRVNPRANLTRSMAAIADKVIAMREPLIFSGTVENLPPQIEKPLADYIHESGSRMVMFLPLMEPEPLIDPNADPKSARPKLRRRVALGCLIIEQISNSQPAPQLRTRAELIGDHVAAALFNALQFQRVFLLRLWRLLGRAMEWLHGRKLLKTLLVLGAVSAVCGALVLIPWEYRVEGEGRLMPVIQRDVFAPEDGKVVEVHVKDGDKVREGQTLVSIHSDELTELLVAARSERDEHLELLGVLATRLVEAGRTPERDDDKQIQGEILETEIKERGLSERIEHLEGRINELQVTAPISGVVATFQLEQLLWNRPVNTGEILLQVMQDEGEWRLELDVEEKRMGHVLRAQRDSSNDHLPVEFILATSPELTFSGRVEMMATRSSTSPEQGSIFQIFVETDIDKLPQDVRPGSEVRAKIACGQRSLGYVLFGDVIEFMRSYFWL